MGSIAQCMSGVGCCAGEATSIGPSWRVPPSGMERYISRTFVPGNVLAAHPPCISVISFPCAAPLHRPRPAWRGDSRRFPQVGRAWTCPCRRGGVALASKPRAERLDAVKSITDRMPDKYPMPIVVCTQDKRQVPPPCTPTIPAHRRQAVLPRPYAHKCPTFNQ